MDFHGRRVYRFRVRVEYQQGLFNDTDKSYHDVVAFTAADAANWTRDNLVDAERLDLVDVVTRGPRGGITHRYMGYESLIFYSMLGRRTDARQLDLLNADWGGK